MNLDSERLCVLLVSAALNHCERVSVSGVLVTITCRLCGRTNLSSPSCCQLMEFRFRNRSRLKWGFDSPYKISPMFMPRSFSLNGFFSFFLGPRLSSVRATGRRHKTYFPGFFGEAGSGAAALGVASTGVGN